MSQPSAARRAVAMAAEGRIAEARDFLDKAAAQGDGEALFARGLWRVDGRLLARDLEAARHDFRLAADAGYRDAARVLAGFLATGSGGPRDWSDAVALLRDWAGRDPASAAEADLIGRMAIDSEGKPLATPAAEPLNAEPRIEIFRALLTEAECEFLIVQGEALFRPARIFHEGQKRWVQDPIRDSHAAGFGRVSEGPFVHALNQRIAAASGTGIGQGETLQLLRYRPGQQYRPHLDAVAGMANQRILTALIPLTDDFEGGETEFPELGLKWRGKKGDMLLFANALPDGRADPRMRHAGCPVRTGTKIMASRWIRQRPPDDPALGFGQHEAGT